VGAPLASIHAAIQRVAVLRAAGRRAEPATVFLRAGTHFVGRTVEVTAAHTAEGGLTIANYDGEHAVVSGGTPIKLGKGDWKKYKVTPPGTFEAYLGWNNVYGRVPAARKDAPGIKYLGQEDSLQACEQVSDDGSCSIASHPRLVNPSCEHHLLAHARGDIHAPTPTPSPARDRVKMSRCQDISPTP